MPKGEYKRELSGEVLERIRKEGVMHHVSFTLQLYLTRWIADANSEDKVRAYMEEKYGDMHRHYPREHSLKLMEVMHRREGPGWGHAYHQSMHPDTPAVQQTLEEVGG